jgi:metal-responsive CopG/Arc/MetJ family transcriptional regulator
MRSKTTPKKGRRRAPAAATAKQARKIVIDFPAPLFQETERAVHELSMNRSTLIRSAVEMYLRAWRREKLEHQIAESFSANVELDRQLVEDFAHADAESDF